jgi:glycosyltransferase involved in cell wall biosynthesis
VKPVSSAQVTLTSGKSLGKDDEVVTFINRNLEPYRGYHIFMRALPKMLKDRPNARFILVGEDGVSYGAKPDKAKYGDRSWK